MSQRTAHVYCGNFVGPPRWHGLDFYEPDECNWEADVPLPETPEEDEFASFVCGGCGATNMVREHECEDRPAFPAAASSLVTPGEAQR